MHTGNFKNKCELPEQISLIYVVFERSFKHFFKHQGFHAEDLLAFFQRVVSFSLNFFEHFGLIVLFYQTLLLMMSYVMSDSRVQFLNFLSKNDVLTAELGISLLEKFELTFEQTSVFFELNLPSLIVIDNMVFEYANFIFHIGCDMRIVEVELFRQKDVTRF